MALKAASVRPESPGLPIGSSPRRAEARQGAQVGDFTLCVRTDNWALPRVRLDFGFAGGGLGFFSAPWLPYFGPH